MDEASLQRTPAGGAWEVFRVFLRLGLTAFGGPVAHLGYFREEFVSRRRWLTEARYADLVALCQFLPGPASSQAGMGLGLLRAGYAGALAAWAGFTLPSAVVMAALGMGMAGPAGGPGAGALQGLKWVAVAVVAQAVWGMARSLCTDAPRVAITVAAATAALLHPGAATQVAVVAVAAVAGLGLPRAPVPAGAASDGGAGSARAGAAFLVLFFALLVLLPAAAAVWHGHALQEADAFYRAGALVFGGGHVVLPLLQAQVVGPGWMSDATFLAGYGAAQAMPGPLFTFAAYLGAAMEQPPAGWAGAALCLVALFLPGFLLVAGTLPFWERLRQRPGARAALAGINAAVVGLLVAAFYQPVWTGGVHGARDFAAVLVALAALVSWRLPPWLVVLAGALGGALLA